MTSVPDAKTMAKALRRELAERSGVDLPHSACLEIVARQLGAASWNILSARPQQEPPLHWAGRASTIPVFRIFDVNAALAWYRDFLGFTVDFGGPAAGGDSPWFGQVSRGRTSLHLGERPYEPSPGSTVDIWLTGLDAYRAGLDERRWSVPVLGPAVWVPEPEEVPWNARLLALTDPFGNTLRLTEPLDAADRSGLPDWA
jgi:catechol 2,3-dioxygenase-like lactoylglutathione lyase family enzyme